MNWKPPYYLVLALLVLAGGALAGCGDSDPSPSGPSVTISAPTIVAPDMGSDISLERPELVVGNVTVSDGGTPSYSFQVATDSSFNNIVAEVSGVAEEAGGQTSWKVAPPLGNGEHFWRARARAGSTDGPFSQTADFSVLTAFKAKEPRDGVLVFDPLTNGSTVGNRKGGTFTDEGWRTNSGSNAIAYNMPTIESGFLEAEIKGLALRNKGSGARHLFIMWDPSISNDFTQNKFRASVQKHDRGSTRTTRYLRIRWISQGRQTDAFSGFLGWDENRFMQFRWQWGPDGPERRLFVRFFIDGVQKIFFEYRQPYRPVIHRIELGAGIRAETEEDVVYRNVVIGVRE
jgi:hypothetical protein